MDRENKSGAVWLGLGEFTHPNESEVQYEARKRFLEAIREVVPEVLTTLATEPLALFQAIWERALATVSEDQRALPHFQLRWSDAFSWGRFKYADPGHDQDGAMLRNRLVHWTQRWNLDRSVDDWIMEVAVDTLQEWATRPEGVQRDNLSWGDYYEGTTVELTDDEQAITFPQDYEWYPQFERRKVVYERIRKDLERRLTEELDRIEAIAEDRLATPPKLISGDAHFRWLVSYQVQDLDWNQVAKRADRSVKQVREAARAIANTAGIELRKGNPRGRPRIHPLSEDRAKRGSGSLILRPTLPITRRSGK